jgi:carbon storage regulator
MLVLERKVQEGFWIEDRIFVKVIGIGRRRVKLGIEAPLESKVIRDELRARPREIVVAEGIEEEAHQR